MANQFDTVRKGGMESILGPSYNYASHIKTPDELGMTDSGGFSNLTRDVKGLLGYIDLLVTGQCKLGNCASTTGRTPDGAAGEDFEGPLGNKFFLPTVTQCRDKATKKMVTRSIYINNVPDGSIPLISNMDSNVSFSTFKGLMPGLLSNIAQIRPTQILMAFVNGKDPLCQAVQLETVNANSVSTIQTGYLTNSDISIMPKRWFPDSAPKSNYDTKEPAKPKKESFTDYYDYSQMPSNAGIKIYYNMLGLLGLYILLRLMLKKPLK
jgi:hypothetical protein